MIKSKFFGHHLIELISVDSTNNYSTNLIRAGEFMDGTVIMADYQTEGKGRRGKKWQAEANMNLTFSLIRKFKNFPIENQFLIIQVVSLAIIESLKEIGITNARIKWPNDILVDRNKIAGILIENVLSGTNIDSTVIGIGLNLNQKEFDDLKATSTLMEIGKEIDKKTILQNLLENMQAGFYQIQMENHNWLRSNYNEKLFGKQDFENYKVSQKILSAKIVNVNSEGGLILQEKNGNELYINKLDEFEWVKQ